MSGRDPADTALPGARRSRRRLPAARPPVEAAPLDLALLWGEHAVR